MGADRELVGQRSLAVATNTYTHVLADEQELDYKGLSPADVQNADGPSG